MRYFFILLSFAIGSYKDLNAQNLIINPGFENSLTNGWTIATGNWNQFTNGFGYGPPNTGTYYTSQGFGPNGTIYQDVDVSAYAVQIDNGTQAFTASGYLQVGSNGVIAQITIEYRNNSGSILLSKNIQETNSNFGVWNFKSVAAIAPAGTRSIRFQLSTSGFDLAMFDDVILTPSSSLPVNFSYVSAVALNNTVIVKWQTANEKDLAKFEIERSKDGIKYQTIYTAMPSANIAPQHNYNYLDKNALSGTNYYRIKEIDIDNNFLYSPIAKAVVTSSKKELFSYSVSVNMLSVRFTSIAENATITLLDMNGGIIKFKSVNNLIENINIESVSSGVYILVLKDAGQSVSTSRVIIHR